MDLEPNISPHEQIVKDYNVKECISIEEIKNQKVSFFFFFKSCNIPHSKWCMLTFGPKPRLAQQISYR